MLDWSQFVARSLIFGSATMLAACGQTGPLYLPAKPAAISTPAATTAPPANKASAPETPAAASPQ